jgi:asparagine synthase (glutamine-hydrolysing)
MGPDAAAEASKRLSAIDYIAEALAPAPATGFGKVATLESSLYLKNQLLRDTDWASMDHSLEVRVPLVDHTLLKRLSALMVNAEKPDGKSWLSASPCPALPDEIRLRPKTGFLIPFQTWISRNSSQAKGHSSARSHWSRRWAIDVARHYGMKDMAAAVAA